MWKLLLMAAVTLPAVSCADLNPTQQRALTGTAPARVSARPRERSVATPGLEPRSAQAPDCSADSWSISKEEPRTGPSKRGSPPDGGRCPSSRVFAARRFEAFRGRSSCNIGQRNVLLTRRRCQLLNRPRAEACVFLGRNRA